MRSINVSLTSSTWEMAKKKKNFSEWVRNKLSEEHNHGQEKIIKAWYRCLSCGKPSPFSTHCVSDICPDSATDVIMELIQ
jgi:hypothetical protein